MLTLGLPRAQAAMSGRQPAPRARSPACTGARRERSLGVLCDKFLAEYGGLPAGAAIGLDAAGALLGVERRRLYDITNVLEAVDVLVRAHKSQCAHTLIHIPYSNPHPPFRASPACWRPWTCLCVRTRASALPGSRSRAHAPRVIGPSRHIGRGCARAHKQ